MMLVRLRVERVKQVEQLQVQEVWTQDLASVIL